MSAEIESFKKANDSAQNDAHAKLRECQDEIASLESIASVEIESLKKDNDSMQNNFDAKLRKSKDAIASLENSDRA